MKRNSSWLLYRMALLSLILLGLAATRLSAATIDASRATTALLQPGDSLLFAIPSWNYTANAARFGLPLYPSGVGFILISADSGVPARFQAGLQSSDGAFSQTIAAPLTFGPGALSSSAYTGPVSALEASFQLTAAASQQIFGGSGAELMLRNLGPAILLGLPATTLQQDLFVSLSGDAMSVGALHGAVLLQEAVPEPPSDLLLIGGGLLLCLTARQLAKPPKNVKSTVCNPIEHSDTI